MPTKTKPLVEVSVKGRKKSMPIGIMNARQALELPEHGRFTFLHHDDGTPRKGEHLNRAEFKEALSNDGSAIDRRAAPPEDAARVSFAGDRDSSSNRGP
ncbi:hypothetical protein JNB88_22805 [Rhizobium cauense]|uniref:hypothetical protein n=1 Tax=Rhizobium cauense TaxID=1166683 RepID=UPI001C6EC81C|nr:hypothetical protein [Rhizobium cauense]MBW9116471.1 hypothetical protein [Rhizobium cauense]